MAVVAHLPAPVRRVVRAAGFAGLTGGYLTAYVARDSMTGDAARSALRDRWVKRWAGSLLRLFGITLEVYGEVPEGERGQLVVANHRSTIDIGVMLRTFGGMMVSRADLSGWPLVGTAANRVGTIFVDRQDANSGAGAIREIRQALQRGATINIFPEGTTFDGDLVRPFHKGAFVAALRTGAAIVPVGIAYARGSGAAFVNESFLAHLSRLAASTPTRVAMCIGAPLVVGPKAKASDLAEQARAAVQALTLDARGRCDGSG